MKADLHPKLFDTSITCTCGAKHETLATQENLKVEICSQCHPFYTGTQKLVDTAGRVERFRRKYGQTQTKDAGKAS